MPLPRSHPLRRAQDPEPGTTLGADIIRAPLAPDRLDPGYIPDTSNPAMKPGPYTDVASGLSQPGEAHANPPPFTLRSR
jgi:hypothetical protein